MGKLLDWDNMPPVGTKVKFVRYKNGHEHWEFEKGKIYTIGKVGKGVTGPISDNGEIPSRNWENSFVFEIATPFTINKGDYIDSREFSREECERFCEFAVECGYSDKYADFSGVWALHGVSADGELISCHDVGSVCRNNITTQFREFLDKEKGTSCGYADTPFSELVKRGLLSRCVAFNEKEKSMSNFTKDDLKSEHNVTYRDLSKRIVFLDSLVAYTKDDIGASYKIKAGLDGFNHDLTHREHKGMDIMRVTDRDGTVLFEREPKKVKLELEVTPEQAEAIRKQLNQ